MFIWYKMVTEQEYDEAREYLGAKGYTVDEAIFLIIKKLKEHENEFRRKSRESPEVSGY